MLSLCLGSRVIRITIVACLRQLDRALALISGLVHEGAVLDRAIGLDWLSLHATVIDADVGTVSILYRAVTPHLIFLLVDLAEIGDVLQNSLPLTACLA